MNEDFDRMVDLLRQWKAVKEQADERIKEAQDAITEYLAEHGQKSMSGMSDGKRFNATVVTTERVTFNESSLKKALGAKLWKTVTVSKIDSALLKRGISSGQIDPIIVAQHSEVKKSAPYIRLSESTQDLTQPHDSSAV